MANKVESTLAHETVSVYEKLKITLSKHRNIEKFSRKIIRKHVLNIVTRENTLSN